LKPLLIVLYDSKGFASGGVQGQRPIDARIVASGLRPIGFDVSISEPPRAPPVNPPGSALGPPKAKPLESFIFHPQIERAWIN
jgi:hypothetical protein